MMNNVFRLGVFGLEFRQIFKGFRLIQEETRSHGSDGWARMPLVKVTNANNSIDQIAEKRATRPVRVRQSRA